MADCGWRRIVSGLKHKLTPLDIDEALLAFDSNLDVIHRQMDMVGVSSWACSDTPFRGSNCRPQKPVSVHRSPR
jgi:hypothetical protein